MIWNSHKKLIKLKYLRWYVWRKEYMTGKNCEITA
ncbi:hypothetical protein BpHYR1_009199 [Brachionus plicatilis]|uniref:Uncharacterized protein n=1 Tax=Brachionus plicatilis TaxID=10195 RepID=A0A3M7PCV7_BRAPC|nr:hypothetical protein BpHYR1_009199 [Brachionus plicatilis]